MGQPFLFHVSSVSLKRFYFYFARLFFATWSPSRYETVPRGQHFCLPTALFAVQPRKGLSHNGSDASAARATDSLRKRGALMNLLCIDIHDIETISRRIII